MSKIDEGEEFRDRVSTIDETGRRKWVFSYKPSGRFYSARSWLSIFYLFVFFGLPFVQYKGEPFILLNILERKFVIFGFVFWSQDFYLFGLTMIMFVVFIIVFTVAFGRLFCGWACPQTIFMEMVFRKIEYLIEGDAPKQLALKRMPWNFEKVWKRTLKVIVFYALSFLIGNTFLAYVIGKDALLKIITEPMFLHKVGFVSMLIFSGIFFFVYYWFREQVCTVVCPYGRLQGVLMDRNSVVVAYDYNRGEPREKLRKNTERNAGDCIDCLKCVHVCPTGIDIRNGNQLECTQCTACIDACDSIMDKIGKPRGLVRYASESTIAENKPFVITARLKAYIAVLIAIFTLWLIILSTRATIKVQVSKVPGQLYIEQPNGTIANLYKVMLINKSHKDFDSLTLKVENNVGTIKMVNQQEFIKLNKEGVSDNNIMFVEIPANQIHERKQKIVIQLWRNSVLLESGKTNFLAPIAN